MSAHWFLILNGKSYDGGNVEDPVRDAVMAMRARGLRIDVRVTWEAGDVARFVGEALAAGCDCVVAAGGDGTLSAVAAALADQEAGAEALPALGLLPLGTANDFADAAGIPPDARAALDLVDTRQATPIDLLRVRANGRTHWCANLASGGFGTAVTVDTNTGLKRMIGGLAYLVTGIAELGRIETSHARIRGGDFAWEGDFIALGVGNGRQAGGGQPLCPDALIDDGLLDLTVIPDLSGELGATVSRLLTEGKHAALEEVAMRARLPAVAIEASRPLTLNLDGEPLEATGFEIACVRARLRMHLPADCPLRRDAATVGP